MALPLSSNLLSIVFLVMMSSSLLHISIASTSSKGFGFRTNMTHVDSGRNLTTLELLQRSIQRSNSRVRKLTPSAPVNNAGVVSTVHYGYGEFLMDLEIGTPPIRFSAVADTGSDLVWIKCKPCTGCGAKSTTPIFDTSRSSTYSVVQCSTGLCESLSGFTTCSGQQAECRYRYMYGDDSTTQGFLATETFTFGGAASVPGIGFGCSSVSSGNGMNEISGIVGLGRSPLSLVSQLGVGKFSYCLTRIGESKQSPLLFGSLATMKGTTGFQSTPLIKNRFYPTYYYLSLEGISVGGVALSIPPSTFALNADDGSGGMIIDSGTTLTYLEAAAFEQVRKAFVDQMQLPVADGTRVGIYLDLCFTADEATLRNPLAPSLVFHFQGGADMDLPLRNYMGVVVVDGSAGLLCLKINKSDQSMSILGNYQQQDMQVLYDLENTLLSFAPEQCDQL